MVGGALACPAKWPRSSRVLKRAQCDVVLKPEVMRDFSEYFSGYVASASLATDATRRVRRAAKLAENSLFTN